MQDILNFFTGIVDLVVSLVDFVIGLIDDIVYMVQLTAVFVGNIPTYFAWLPGTFVATIVVIFSIVVIYKIIGREG